MGPHWTKHQMEVTEQTNKFLSKLTNAARTTLDSRKETELHNGLNNLESKKLETNATYPTTYYPPTQEHCHNAFVQNKLNREQPRGLTTYN